MDFIVVGVGWAGANHVKAIRAADARVAAIVDADEAHLREQADALVVEAGYTDLREALEAEPDAEAVVVATPHDLHRPHTELAAAAGRHVLVEKPIALTLEDADAMIEACDRAGVALMVGESLRYDRTMIALRRALEAGRIGQVLSGRINFIARGYHTYRYPGRRSWLAEPEEGGSGIWMLNGIHVMSAARMIFGEVRSIDARQVRSDCFEDDVEATVVALLEFEGGAAATITVSAELHGYGRFGDLAVFGSTGTLWSNWRKGDRLLIYSGDAGEPEAVECASDKIDGAPGSFVRQVRELVDAVEAGREPRTGGRDERATLAAILAGYRSIETARPVEPA